MVSAIDKYCDHLKAALSPTCYLLTTYPLPSWWTCISAHFPVVDFFFVLQNPLAPCLEEEAEKKPRNRGRKGHCHEQRPNELCKHDQEPSFYLWGNHHQKGGSNALLGEVLPKKHRRVWAQSRQTTPLQQKLGLPREQSSRLEVALPYPKPVID